MAIVTTMTTTICCHKLPSSTPFTPPNSSTKPNQISWYGKVATGPWRKQCFVGMTCMIIGTEMMMPLMGTDHYAIAENYMEEEIVAEKESNKMIRDVVMKWSDTRSCPAWNMNSLEIIVPENLPRPSSHRKSESIAFSKINPSTRITIKLKVSKNGNCFSM